METKMDVEDCTGEDIFIIILGPMGVLWHGHPLVRLEYKEKNSKLNKGGRTKGELIVRQPACIVYSFKDARASVKVDNKFIF